MAIVFREQWGSIGSYTKPMKLPAIGVHIHHSVTHVSADAGSDARDVEGIGISRFGRGSYSYLFHPNGTVLELAGDRVGAHTVSEVNGVVTRNWNPDTYGCCFIGDYRYREPTSEQIAAFGYWWRWKVNEGKLNPDAFIMPHNSRKATECPAGLGNYIEEFIRATQTEDDLVGSAEEIHDIWAMLTSNGTYKPPMYHLGEAMLGLNHFLQVQLPTILTDIEARQNVDDAAVLNAVAETQRQLTVVVGQLKTAMEDVLTQPIKQIVSQAVEDSLGDTVKQIIQTTLNNVEIQGKLVSE